MRGKQSAFRPLQSRGRRTVGAIILAFGLFSGLSLFLSIRTTTHAAHQAPMLEIAARQRTLAEAYTKDVLLQRAGVQADPATIASLLQQSASALLLGGVAPAEDGDDDEARMPAATGMLLKRQISQEGRLVHDLAATGVALLAGTRGPMRLTAREHLPPRLTQIQRLIVLTGLTSNVSLNVARTMGQADDARVSRLIRQQILLGILGLLVFGLLSWALIRSTRRRNAHFRSLVTSTTDLVLAFSGDRCSYASRSVLQMLGRSESEVLGAGFLTFVHPDDRGALLEVITTGAPASAAFRLPGTAGNLHDLEANVTDLRDDKDVQCIVLNARDVTERNRAEAARESVLAQEKVANERLRELDGLKDEFVALVSHELRTPLTSISGYLELLLEGSLADDQRDFAQIIGRNSDRLLALINDLLFIAQIEAGQLTVEHDSIELGVLAEQAVAAAFPIARNAGVDLGYEPGAELLVSGDAGRLGQLLDNLVSNAIKFTPKGGRVELAVGTLGDKAWIEVRDTGIGISEADQEQLFNKFFRTKAATHAAIQGTGLGLAITKAIVHGHGGSIHVESTENVGSVFRVELPLRRPIAVSAVARVA
jgi:PAS domain S-box-containing protein